MNMRDVEQLGVRQSVAAFIGFSIAGFGSVFLILVVFALVVARSTDAGPVFDAAGKGMSSVGVGVGASFDELTAIAATVVLGFYVVVLGGQLSVNLDVIALRTSLSLTAVGIACALNVAGLTTIVARFQHPDSIGYSAVVVAECALVSGLAIALTSQILLRRSLQIEQEAASLSRARSDIRRLARRLSGLPRRSGVAAAVPALVHSRSASHRAGSLHVGS